MLSDLGSVDQKRPRESPEWTFSLLFATYRKFFENEFVKTWTHRFSLE